MLYCSVGSKTTEIMHTDLTRHLFDAFYRIGNRKRVLVIPPDITRNHSMAGEITSIAWKYYGDKIADVLPALGTHLPMTSAEKSAMFPGVPIKLFLNHDWRRDIVTIGNAGAEFIMNISEGKLSYEWPAQVNRLLVEGKHDLMLSIGQVVPHEVAGMAGYNKNIFIGVGGADGINKSHFLGAVYGIERILGRPDTPVRRVLDYASYHFASAFPIVYVLTVIAKNTAGRLCMRGLFIGDDRECFELASKLSIAVNVETVERPIKKAIVYLEPESYRSTWLGNKSIYRTRMAIEDGGELVVIAPGVERFGEDREIDALIRKYGYRGTDRVLEEVESNEDLHANLSAAAHLIHGSSEDRFEITYCPAKLDKKEIESVNFKYEKFSKVVKKYDPHALRDGFNTMPDGENVFYVSNPALGLWVRKDGFAGNQTDISTAQ